MKLNLGCGNITDDDLDEQLGAFCKCPSVNNLARWLLRFLCGIL
jgi:hypothetical protein